MRKQNEESNRCVYHPAFLMLSGCILIHPFSTSFLGIIEIIVTFISIYGMLPCKKENRMCMGLCFCLLQDGIYPIVRVRMKGSGNFHFVLIVKSERGKFWCMDPMVQTDSLVSLEEFGNRIYAVRYLE